MPSNLIDMLPDPLALAKGSIFRCATVQVHNQKLLLYACGSFVCGPFQQTDSGPLTKLWTFLTKLWQNCGLYILRGGSSGLKAPTEYPLPTGLSVVVHGGSVMVA